MRQIAQKPKYIHDDDDNDDCEDDSNGDETGLILQNLLAKLSRDAKTDIN